MPTPVLVGSGLTKSYGATRALVNGHLEAYAGEVHAIVGENGAGKSTLMNIFSGVVAPDSGTIQLEGTDVTFAGPDAALEHGVGIVHQELSLCPDLSVAENMFLGFVPRGRWGLARFGEMSSTAARMLELFKTDAQPYDRVSDLSIGQQQVVEIARTLVHECKVIIFDEPTSSLTETESEALYGIIADLKARGIAIIFISHRMTEVFELCDRVTVMRDGAWVATRKIDETTPDEIVTMMVGRDLGGLYPPKNSTPGAVAITAEGFSRGRDFVDISFSARYGEILGFAGLVGSGRSEALRAVVGIDPSDAGSLHLDGSPVKTANYADLIARGVGYMSEDRKGDGLFLSMSIEANTIVAILRRLSSGGIIARGRSHDVSRNALTSLRTKMASLTQPVGALSGGNQQKVMLAKWLVTDPRVLILDEPTRGIDIGAKHEIHALLRQLADAGMCVIVISSDLPEVIGLSDRIAVMREGRIVAELSGDDVNEDTIITHSSAPTAA